MIYTNTDTYDGQWRNGYRHGQGAMVCQEGTYFGQWQKDLKDGIGRMDYCDGSVYEGSFFEGKKHGKGTWTIKSDSVKCAGIASYIGDWVNDIREGLGELTFSTGDKYIGALEGGVPHGNGKMILPNKISFSAKFTNGMIDGKVEMSNEKGEIVHLDSDGQVLGEVDGVEFLLPPFLPPLSF